MSSADEKSHLMMVASLVTDHGLLTIHTNDALIALVASFPVQSTKEAANTCERVDGFSLSEWAAFARKKAAIASSVAKLNGELKAKLAAAGIRTDTKTTSARGKQPSSAAANSSPCSPSSQSMSSSIFPSRVLSKQELLSMRNSYAVSSYDEPLEIRCKTVSNMAVEDYDDPFVVPNAPPLPRYVINTENTFVDISESAAGTGSDGSASCPAQLPIVRTDSHEDVQVNKDSVSSNSSNNSSNSSSNEVGERMEIQEPEENADEEGIDSCRLCKKWRCYNCWTHLKDEHDTCR